MADIDAQDIDEIVRSECAACRDEVDLSDVMLASCGCIYCKDCVNRLFDLAARSESDFPPRCCGLFITLEIAEQHLSVDVKNKFQEAYEEFTTTDRIYCSDPRCARFISPKAIDDGRAKCPTCRRLTCILCKEEAHVFDCPEDPAVRSLMTAAAQLGFQQCRECKRMVELMDGCYHIT